MALNLALDADQKMLLSGTIHANIKHDDHGQALKPFELAQRYTGLFDADVNLALGGKTQPPTGSSTIRCRDARAGNDVRLVITQHAQQTGFEGTGEFHGEPFRLSGSVGALESVISSEAVPVDLVVQMLETKAILHGSIREPLQLKGFKLALDIAGPTPQQLDPVIGVHLPDLPPFLFAATSPLIVEGLFKAIDFHPSRSSLIACGAAALALAAIAPPPRAARLGPAGAG